MYMPIPMVLGVHSQGSYLVFYENYPRRQGQRRPNRGAESTHLLPVRRRHAAPILHRRTSPRALERYTELTGRASLPRAGAWATTKAAGVIKTIRIYERCSPASENRICR
ncbi:MAG: hypothetical protein MZV70_16195 [Desulfobacterales bacterium]|nr:hypothetical protein [Desulfobacterales bacterium]